MYISNSDVDVASLVRNLILIFKKYFISKENGLYHSVISLYKDFSIYIYIRINHSFLMDVFLNGFECIFQLIE